MIFVFSQNYFHHVRKHHQIVHVKITRLEIIFVIYSCLHITNIYIKCIKKCRGNETGVDHQVGSASGVGRNATREAEKVKKKRENNFGPLFVIRDPVAGVIYFLGVTYILRIYHVKFQPNKKH